MQFILDEAYLGNFERKFRPMAVASKSNLTTRYLDDQEGIRQMQDQALTL